MQQTWQRLATVAAMAAGVMLSGGCAPATMAGTTVGAPLDQASMERVVSGWAPASREAVRFMMDKYGAPAEMTATMAVWNRTGPWKRTIIYSEAIDHNFPMPHPDVMEQFIDYHVPLDRYDELAMYDGSVIAERTKGEISARCDKEAANFLAINLAHDVATGARTVDEARQFYAEQIMAFMNGSGGPYTQGLQFTPPPDPDDPDHEVM